MSASAIWDIDTSSPPTTLEVTAIEGDDTRLLVTPMQPRKRALKVSWHVKPLAADDENGPDPPQVDEESHTFEDIFMAKRRRGYGFGGQRGRKNRDEYEEAPAHYPRTTLWVEPLGRQARLAALVYRGQRKWTGEDEKHLLEERLTWWVRVSPKPPK